MVSGVQINHQQSSPIVWSSIPGHVFGDFKHPLEKPASEVDLASQVIDNAATVIINC